MLWVPTLNYFPLWSGACPEQMAVVAWVGTAGLADTGEASTPAEADLPVPRCPVLSQSFLLLGFSSPSKVRTRFLMARAPLKLFSRLHHLSQYVFLPPRVQCRPPLCRFCFTSLSKANHVCSLLLSVLFLSYISAALHSTWWRTAMLSFLTLLGNTGVLFSNPHLWAVSCTSLGLCTDGRPAETETTRLIHTGHGAVRRW